MPCDQGPRMAARVERERCGEEAGEGPGSSQAHEPLLASPYTDLEQEQCVSSLLAHYQEGSHWTACRVPGKQSCGKDCTGAGGSGLGRGRGPALSIRGDAWCPRVSTDKGPCASVSARGPADGVLACPGLKGNFVQTDPRGKLALVFVPVAMFLLRSLPTLHHQGIHGSSEHCPGSGGAQVSAGEAVASGLQASGQHRQAVYLWLIIS